MGSLEGFSPNTFTAPDDTTLDASTTYWITVNEDTGQSDRVNLKQTGSTGETGGQRGWKIGNNHLWKIPGGAWTPANDSILLIHIRGFSGIFCGRTPAVRDALVALIPGVTDCIDVSDAHLAAITGVLNLNHHGIADLAAGDFAGLTSLNQLYMFSNLLTELPAGVFDELTSLESLYLTSNQLADLNAGVFDKLTGLKVLQLADNELPELSAEVFEELSALQTLNLTHNLLTDLPAGVFEELTLLESLDLANNPGPDGNTATADFAPVAVALPDGERVPTGNTVRLDGSGSGGPWGTNVTYRWELTDPASGVMEMFDDDTSVTPQVTIPKLAVDTDLTFTLTVTGRGGASGTAPGTDTATVTMNTTGICGRTPEVRDRLVEVISAVTYCADVTDDHLAAISGEMSFSDLGITALAAGDFAGLTEVTILYLSRNELTTLPAGVFAGLTSLRTLGLLKNQLTVLPAGVFDGLTSMRVLWLDDNELTTLRLGVFDELTELRVLTLISNELTRLPDGVFEELTSLDFLYLSGNPGPDGDKATDDFAPVAVALPDGERVPTGNTVMLDGSGSDGGPWGTNVTYRWELTAPASGVMEMFDDDTSVTPRVTIPKLAADTDLTFTLTVTGRGTSKMDPDFPVGTGTAPGTDTATMTVNVSGICGRTPEVRDALVELIPDVTYCADVTDDHLAAITGVLNLTSHGIADLAAGDFAGLTKLDHLYLTSNYELTRLPDGVFDELTRLQSLHLNYT